MLVCNGTVMILVDKQPTLEEAQAFVNGYVELLVLSKDEQIVINEEGLLKELPINYWASLKSGRIIVGNVILLKGKACWK